jgi:hypothetical protein
MDDVLYAADPVQKTDFFLLLVLALSGVWLFGNPVLCATRKAIFALSLFYGRDSEVSGTVSSPATCGIPQCQLGIGNYRIEFASFGALLESPSGNYSAAL